MNYFIAFAVTAIYENQKICEFVERFYWIEAQSALEAFDEVTMIADAYDKHCTIAFQEIRECVGITELIPVLATPENGNVIGQRIYSLDEEKTIRNSVMNRDEFIELMNERRFACSKE
jgi:hypothetical protein